MSDTRSWKRVCADEIREGDLILYHVTAGVTYALVTAVLYPVGGCRREPLISVYFIDPELMKRRLTNVDWAWRLV